NLVAGTGSSSAWRIFPPVSRHSRTPGCISETRWKWARGAGRSSSRILTATPWSSSNQHGSPPERLPPPSEGLRNLSFFLRHDSPAVRRYQLDVDARRDASARIVPAVGKSARGSSDESL